VEPTVVATDGLDAATLAAGRALCDLAFDGAFDDTDWSHSLGGVHALVHEDGRLVGHAALVPRTLWHDGRALRAGYVEGVAVDPASQGRGHGRALMRALEAELRAGYELGALSATDAGAPLYARCGWRRWEGPTSVRTPDGVVRTPDDDGAVWVLEVAAPLAPGGELTCDWRDGDVW
jgi:aminoglycoside 2'-N-acetyltransferase I